MKVATRTIFQTPLPCLSGFYNRSTRIDGQFSKTPLPWVSQASFANAPLGGPWEGQEILLRQRHEQNQSTDLRTSILLLGVVNFRLGRLGIVNLGFGSCQAKLLGEEYLTHHFSWVGVVGVILLQVDLLVTRSIRSKKGGNKSSPLPSTAKTTVNYKSCS